MDDGANVVFLKFRSPAAEPDTMAFIGCRVCHNKTFTLTEDRVDDFPLMRCAVCGQHMGRMGWSHDDPETAPSPEDCVDIDIVDQLGPLSREALHRHPRKFWALEEIRSYARFLHPRPLKDGDDAELAKLIDKGRAP